VVKFFSIFGSKTIDNSENLLYPIDNAKVGKCADIYIRVKIAAYFLYKYLNSSLSVFCGENIWQQIGSGWVGCLGS